MRFILTLAISILLSVLGFVFTYNTENRWIGHGIVSLVGLYLVIEIVITGAMLKGRIKSSRPNLFGYHRNISILFGSLMLGTFFYGLAVAAQQEEELLGSVHGWLGLVIAALALFQVILSLLVKRRASIRFPHMILGYALILLVTIQVTLGIELAMVGEVKSLVVIHSTLGGIAAIALIRVLVEMRHLSEGALARARIANFIAAFSNIIGCWVIGGYNYLTNYPQIRDAIKAGNQPWAHQVVMETKEHVFLFLPVISLVLVVMLGVSQPEALIKDTKSRRAIMLTTALALSMILLMFVMGGLISNAGRIGMGE